jgi:peptidoglycan/xylan/chitin deacetylase (PgdA/CDA1 family)
LSRPLCWPDDRPGVSLKFDDGLDSHLEQAVPLLEEHGFRGTFYLCPAGSESEWLERSRPWQAVLARGHEIGNHTLSHPIPTVLSEDESASDCYERLTLERYRTDVLEAERRLDLAFGKGERTFCYPCYQTWVGRGAGRCSVVPFIAEHFQAAVAGGEISRPYNPPASCDLHALMSVRANGLSADDMVQHLRQAADAGRWIIYTFHDVGEGRLATSRSAFVSLLAWLAARHNRLRVAPVLDVAMQVRKLRGET